MAEVEAICAKLQNRSMLFREDVTNGMNLEESSDCKTEDFHGRRRKRKTNYPQYVNHGLNENPEDVLADGSCCALDLSINQSVISDNGELKEVFQERRFLHNSNILPNCLHKLSMDGLINNKDTPENFGYGQDRCVNKERCKGYKRESLANSDSMSDDEFDRSASKSKTTNNTATKISTSHTFDGDLLAKESLEIQDEYIKRFSSYEECKDEQCRQSLLRDHFHCIQCSKTILRREETIRHSKWHKKREESLHFNFMRFSPVDDCEDLACSYNGRQTHYHCLHQGCKKVYISTSDVQMHSNYHKKDIAINKEGFQRFRASEMCLMETCSYNNQRTTHFHCRRENCKFTFKNKADMDKHKGHHQRNDHLLKEGFRKYIKYEHCDFIGCKFSKLMNHIHCIRPNCDYVVHSSAQINSHRRKHERRMLTTGSILPSDHMSDSSSILNLSKNTNDLPLHRSSIPFDNNDSRSFFTCALQINRQFFDKISSELTDWDTQSQWIHETRRFTPNDHCTENCDLLYKDHYHCLFTGCTVAFMLKEKVRDHCRRHKLDDLLLKNGYKICTEPGHINGPNNTHAKLHYHCRWMNCTFLRVGPEVNPGVSMDFNFLQEIYDHFDFHERRFQMLVNGENSNTKESQSSDDSNDNSDIYQFAAEADTSGSFQMNTERKRGRPPKYRKNIYIPKMELSNEDLNDDETITELTKDHFLSSKNGIKCGFKFYSSSHVFCADDMCMFYGRSEHFHCLRPRCHLATDSMTAVNLHRREFHHYMQIEQGYGYFDRSINCRRSHCQNNRVHNHYHCVRTNCDYSFKRFSTMHQHTSKHQKVENQRLTSGLPCDERHSFSPVKMEDEKTLAQPSNFSASSLISPYSPPPKQSFPLQNYIDDIFNHPSKNSLTESSSLAGNIGNHLSSNMTLDFLVNFSSSLSPITNSLNGFFGNSVNSYPFFPEHPRKVPRLQPE